MITFSIYVIDDEQTIRDGIAMTLEADYRQAMQTIESQQMPLAESPILVSNWPTEPPVQPEREISGTRLDNSV